MASVAVRPIRIVGDPVLHTPTQPVTVFDDALRELVADMFDTMEAADGVGPRGEPGRRAAAAVRLRLPGRGAAPARCAAS